MAFQQIKEYINRDSGTSGTLLIPQTIFGELVDEQEKALLPREMAAYVLTGFPGSTVNINRVTEDSFGGVERVAEGAEVPMDATGYSNLAVSPVKYGIAIRITREMIEDSQFDLLAANVRIAGRRFAENETNLILTALDGADNSVSGGATITIANITTAMRNVEDASYKPTDLLIGSEVLEDLRNIDTFVEANKAGDTDMLRTGWRGVIYGMNVVLFDDSASPTPGTYRKYAYVLDRSRAYVIALKRDVTMDKFDLPTYDMQGVVLTQRIAVELLRSAAVSRITTS